MITRTSTTCLLRGISPVLADNTDLVRHQISRAKTDSEVSSRGNVASSIHGLHESLGTLLDDGSEVVHELVLRHADSGNLDRNRRTRPDTEKAIPDGVQDLFFPVFRCTDKQSQAFLVTTRSDVTEIGCIRTPTRTSRPATRRMLKGVTDGNGHRSTRPEAQAVPT